MKQYVPLQRHEPGRAAFAFRDGWDKQGVKAGRPVGATQAFRRGSGQAEI